MLRPGEHAGLSMGLRNPVLPQQKEGRVGQSWMVQDHGMMQAGRER